MALKKIKIKGNIYDAWATSANVYDAQEEIIDALGNIDLSGVAQQGSDPNVSLTSVDGKIDDFYDTFDADIALQLQGIIGDTEESVGGTSQTAAQVEELRTLQESYDALADVILPNQTTLTQCYIEAEKKYATLPQERTLANLPSTIASINALHGGPLCVSALTIASAHMTVVDFNNVIFYNSFPNLTGVQEAYNLRNAGGYQYIGDTGKASIIKLSFADYSANPGYFRCNSLQWLDATGLHIESGKNFTQFANAGLLRTVIGDHTLEEAVAGLTAFDGIDTSQNFFSGCVYLGRKDFRAIINGLADLTGSAAQTLTLGANNLAMLTADDIAVATNKNWTLA